MIKCCRWLNITYISHIHKLKKISASSAFETENWLYICGMRTKYYMFCFIHTLRSRIIFNQWNVWKITMYGILSLSNFLWRSIRWNSFIIRCKYWILIIAANKLNNLQWESCFFRDFFFEISLKILFEVNEELNPKGTKFRIKKNPVNNVFSLKILDFFLILDYKH